MDHLDPFSLWAIPKDNSEQETHHWGAGGLDPKGAEEERQPGREATPRETGSHQTQVGMNGKQVGALGSMHVPNVLLGHSSPLSLEE
jgi:hypothetical protein